jgi:hypothetical protein
MSWLVSLICFLFGHDADLDRCENLVGDCRRCGSDVRPSWLVELDMHDRLEAMAVRAIEKRRRASS